jgi:hypothetical protein
MRDLIAYLHARLAEPGSQRSLAVVLFAIQTGVASADAWQSAISLLIGLLGSTSFLKPEAGSLDRYTDAELHLELQRRAVSG